jgi:hypothetical protein
MGTYTRPLVGSGIASKVNLVRKSVPTMQSDREYVAPPAGVVINAKMRANAESENIITSDGRPVSLNCSRSELQDSVVQSVQKKRPAQSQRSSDGHKADRR